MHDGQNRQAEVLNPSIDLTDSLTDGEGKSPANSNPDLVGSITISAYENDIQEPDTYENARQSEENSYAHRPNTYTHSDADILPDPQNQFMNNAALQQGQDQVKSTNINNENLANITISKGSLKFGDVLKVQKEFVDMLNSKNVAAAIDFVRGENGMAKTVVKNSFEKNPYEDS